MKASIFTAMLACFALTGCYTLQPVGAAAPQVGTRVALDVNDAGRVALGGSMGPEIGQVEGQLLEMDSSEYLVAVSAVRLLRGGEQRWNGESVRIRREHVYGTSIRRFSKGRTLALSAIGVTALALLVNRSLNPGGSIEEPIIPIDTNATRRVPFPAGLRPRTFGRTYSPLRFQPHLSRP